MRVEFVSSQFVRNSRHLQSYFYDNLRLRMYTTANGNPCKIHCKHGTVHTVVQSCQYSVKSHSPALPVHLEFSCIPAASVPRKQEDTRNRH